MPEIIITNPLLNRDVLRAHSYDTGITGMRETFPLLLSRQGVTPVTYPRAIDLCAGDGSFARILVDNGWDETNMACVDMFCTSTPLVPRAKWLYWDLESLYSAIVLDKPIPAEVLEYQHQFDIAILWNGGLFGRAVDIVCEYLVRSEGYIVHNKRY